MQAYTKERIVFGLKYFSRNISMDKVIIVQKSKRKVGNFHFLENYCIEYLGSDIFLQISL